MSKIDLDPITSGYNLSKINANFQKVEDELNNKVLYRQIQYGESNEMQTNLDMNGKQIINVATGTSDGALVTKGYVDQGLALKFDKSGGPISGSIDMNSNEIRNVSKLSANTLEIGGVQAVPTNLVIDPYNGTREALRRSYSDAGYNMVDGSFELGAVLQNATDAILLESAGKAYSWGGTLPVTVPAGSTPTTGSAWIPLWGITLRAELAADNGADLVYFRPNAVGLSVKRSLSDILEDLFSIESLDQTDLVASFQQAINNGIKSFYVPPRDYVLDNTLTPLNINVDGVTIFGPGTIKFTRYDLSGIYVTGTNCRLLDFAVEGPGTVDPVYSGPSSGILNAFCPGLISLVGVTTVDSPIELGTVVDGVRVINPGIKGISAYKALDFKITNCRVVSDYPIASLFNKPQFFGISAYTCANFDISNNETRGCSQGISVGALGSGYTFDDKIGGVSHTSRHFTMSNNRVFACNDHGIYVSNDASNYSVNDNYLWPASSSENGAGGGGLKLEGGFFSATGNTCRDGIVLRNVYDCDVSGNIVPVYSGIGAVGNGNVKWGIMHEETVFKRPAKNVSITNNVLSVVGDVATTGAIQFTGRVWDGYQSVISNLKITGNQATGFGKETQTASGLGVGYGIYVVQQLLMSGGVVVDVPAKSINISNNVIDVAPGANVGSYGVFLGNAIDEAVVTNNVLTGMTKQAVRSLGVRKSLFHGNSVVPLSGATISDIAFEERQDSGQTIHVISQQNIYGMNRVGTAYPAKYFVANETSRIDDFTGTLVNLGTQTSVTLQAYGVAETIYMTPSSAATLTLGTAMAWPIGMAFSIVNGGTASVTVNRPVGGSVSIPAGSSKKLISVGVGNLVVQ